MSGNPQKEADVSGSTENQRGIQPYDDIAWWDEREVPLYDSAYYSLQDNPDSFQRVLIILKHRLQAAENVPVVIETVQFFPSQLMKIVEASDNFSKFIEWWNQVGKKRDTRILVWQTALTFYSQMSNDRPELHEEQISWFKMLGAHADENKQYPPYETIMLQLRLAMCQRFIIDRSIEEHTSALKTQ